MDSQPGNAAAAAGPNGNLAIVVDKRPAHRPGGCTGIFFQLFNWNRRLAKKKFFSRKLLPQDRAAAKRISRKLAGEERMPAATMPAAIVAENRGNFLNIKKVEKLETAAAGTSVRSSDRERRMTMISPGLVARLMGLESMPAAARLDGKPRKAVDDASTSSEGCCDNDNAGSVPGSPRREPKLGAGSGGGGGHGKLQLRPRKPQKLGLFDRRPTSAARVGSEALLFSRSMLARSRKQQHKLASPVKSPRLAGRRSSARLMEAATRILEPGLQSRNRNRRALPYMAPLPRPGAGAPFVSPCHNCGSLVEVPDPRLKPDEPPPPPATEHRRGASSSCSDFSSSTSSHSGFDDAAAASPPAAVPRENKRTPSLAAQAKANVQSRSHHASDRKSSHPRTGFQDHDRPQLDSAASPSFSRQNHLRQNHEMPLVGEGAAPAASRLGTRTRGTRESGSFNEAKDLAASNRNLSSCHGGKHGLPYRSESARFSRIVANQGKPDSPDSHANRTDSHRFPCKSAQFMGMDHGKSDSPDAANLGGKTKAMASRRTTAMERSSWERKHLVCKGKEKGPRLTTARTLHGSSVKSQMQKKMEGGDFSSGSKAAAMNALSSCAGAAGNSHGSVAEKRWNRLGRRREGVSESRTSPARSAAGKLPSERVMDHRIGALGVLLEQKIRELACSDQDKPEAGDGVRPTAAILDHLISALSAARAISLKKDDDDSAFGLGMQDAQSVCTCSHGSRPDIVHNYQAEGKSGISAALLRANDYEQHSPMSILEASFSNDSCLSESFNSSSGHRQHTVLMESSFDKLFPQDLDTDLSDSATLSNFRTVDAAKTPSISDTVSLVHGMDFNSVGSSGSKINYFKGVILNAELLFTHASLDMLPNGPPSSIDHMLLDTLETLFDALGGGHVCNLNYPGDRDGVQFRSFLFDYIIEHLDMKYSHCTKTGYRTWVKKMPLLTADRLTLEIYEDIISCRDQAGEILDEMVQKEMVRTDGEWMYFLVEAFEAGVEIGNGLLQLLVDEIVIDLIHC